MITINQLRDDIVDAIVDLLIANQVITDISELQYIINQQTGVIEAGRLDNDQPIVISSNDYQGINENFVRLINNVAVCLALPDNQYEEF